MMIYVVTAGTRAPQTTAVVDGVVTVDGLGPWLAAAYAQVGRVLDAQRLRPAGAPFARYHVLGEDRFRVEAGFPVARWIDPVGGVRTSRLPGGPVVTTSHVGPYRHLAHAHDAVAKWIYGHRGTIDEDAWEIYLTDPAGAADPAAQRTEIVQPYRALDTH